MNNTDSDMSNIFLKYTIPPNNIFTKENDNTKKDLELSQMLNKYSHYTTIKNTDSNLQLKPTKSIVIQQNTNSKFLKSNESLTSKQNKKDNKCEKVYNNKLLNETNTNTCVNIQHDSVSEIKLLKQEINNIYALYNDDIKQRKELFEIMNKKINELQQDIKKLTKLYNKLKEDIIIKKKKINL